MYKRQDSLYTAKYPNLVLVTSADKLRSAVGQLLVSALIVKLQLMLDIQSVLM